jgi:hypothetical protein
LKAGPQVRKEPYMETVQITSMLLSCAMLTSLQPLKIYTFVVGAYILAGEFHSVCYLQNHS